MGQDAPSTFSNTKRIYANQVPRYHITKYIIIAFLWLFLETSRRNIKYHIYWGESIRKTELKRCLVIHLFNLITSFYCISLKECRPLSAVLTHLNDS